MSKDDGLKLNVSEGELDNAAKTLEARIVRTIQDAGGQVYEPGTIAFLLSDLQAIRDITPTSDRKGSVKGPALTDLERATEAKKAAKKHADAEAVKAAARGRGKVEAE